MAEAQHELIPLSQPERWEAAVAQLPHGHAHTWGFCRAAQLTSGVPSYLYRYSRGRSLVVCPLCERQFSGQTDIVTPYGFGGFTASGPCAEFARDWSAFARSRGWVCGYISLNPLFFEAEGFDPEEVHVHNRLYVMDLLRPQEEIVRGLSQNRRRQLREWPSVAATLNHDRGELTAFLLANYAAFFTRKEAGSATRFTAATMTAVAELEDVFMVGAGEGRRLESVAVFGHTAHAADLLFNISVPGGERYAVHLTWSGVEHFRELGVRSLNLGGGIRPEDNVAEFKRRFGAAELPLRSLRQVYRPAEYERLCRQAGKPANSDSGYFPAYHA